MAETKPVYNVDIYRKEGKQKIGIHLELDKLEKLDHKLKEIRRSFSIYERKKAKKL